MEALGSVWIPIGLITASLMAIFDKDMRSTGMMVFMTLLGPITPVLAVFMMIYALASDSGAPKPKHRGSSSGTKPKNPSPSSPIKTDEELCREYSSLVTKLTSIFLADEEIKPTKGNFASVQRLGALARKNAVKPVVDKETVVKILESSLTKIQDVYGSSTTGVTRTRAIEEHIEKLSGSQSKSNNKSSDTNSSPSKKREESGVIGFNLNSTESQSDASEGPASRPQKSNFVKGASGEENNPKKKLTIDIKY